MAAGYALVLAQYAAALSVFGHEEKSMEKRLLRRADEDANVTIPAAISVAPSQYWDGNGMDTLFNMNNLGPWCKAHTDWQSQTDLGPHSQSSLVAEMFRSRLFV